MASTSNKNTPGNYCLQQRSYGESLAYTEYANSQYGHAFKPAMPALGITPSHMPRNTLSNNPVAIESSLFGIGSTNLVDPQRAVVPELKDIPTINFFERTPLVMPAALEPMKNQRPFPVPE